MIERGPMSTLTTQLGLLGYAAGLLVAVLGAACSQAQGTVTFDQPWLVNGIAYHPFYYDSSGMEIRVVHSVPQTYDNMARIGVGLAGHVNNGTPHIQYTQTPGYSEYVVLSLTNGSLFGVTSVDLADIVAPSTNAVSISFNGFMADGSMVSTTFTTAGGGTSAFQTFLFGPSFGSGLTRLEIPSTVWAMDNLVFVPEPGAASLLGLGLLSLAAWRFKRRQR